MLINECIRCLEHISVEVTEKQMMFFCPKCKMMVANKFYEKRGENDKIKKQ